MKKTIAVFAHVDAGKTTFSESLLFNRKIIKNCGRVDFQTTLLDHHELERLRGITIFSDLAHFNMEETMYYLIDTPGHVDFTFEMERTLSVIDAGIILVSATDGIQSHTHTIWNLLRKHQLPTMIFINKMDRDTVELTSLLKELKKEFGSNVLYLNENVSDETWLDFVVEQDESLLEEYLEENYDTEAYKKRLSRYFMKGEVFPCFSGSALYHVGIDYFLNQMHELLQPVYEVEPPFTGRVYQMRIDEQGNQVAFIKALSGTLSVREPILYGQTQIQGKINHLRRYQGNKFEQIQCVQAGDVFGALGLSDIKIGDGIGDLPSLGSPLIMPTMEVEVIQITPIHPQDLLAIFKKLEIENPTLQVKWDETLQVIHIAVMGVIQLEILKEIISSRYQLEVEFGPCQIIYKETISNEVTGAGHYEPLGHYAEVHVKLSPNKRGSGLQFNSQLHHEHLAISFQNLIKTYVYEREHVGVLTGSNVTDVTVTLIAGASHQKHTSGGDFKEATYRAIRQGLEKATNVLLEPYYEFNVEVDLSLMGRVIHDILKASGTFSPPETSDSRCMIKGVVPVATFMEYPVEFMRFTKGKGKLNLNVLGYDVCHNSDEIIKLKGYDKERDRQNVSASIFCAKGSGFVVPWHEADAYMHCLK